MAHPRGISLMETVIAVGASGALLVGLGSAVVIASGSLPGSDSETSSVLESTRAINRVAADLAQCTRIWNISSSELRLTLPDQDGDGEHEPIRYTWAGSGDPWERTEESAASMAVIENADAVVVRVETEPYTLAMSERALVWGAPEAFDEDRDNPDAGVVEITSQLALASPIVVSHPAGTSSWMITDVSFAVDLASEDDKGCVWISEYDQATHALGEATMVEAYSLNAGQIAPDPPSLGDIVGGIIDTISVADAETRAETRQWVTVGFSDPIELDPNKDYALVIVGKHHRWTVSIPLETEAGRKTLTYAVNGTDIDNDTVSVGSGLSGSMAVVGTRQTQVPGMTQSWSAARRINVEVQTPHGTLSRDVSLVNEPDVLEFVAHAEFESSPASSDANADGVGDWVRADASAFDSGSIRSGAWEFDTTIQTVHAPTTGPLRAELRWKSTSAQRLVFQAPSDHDGSEHLRCGVGARLGAGGQIVTLFAFDAERNSVELDKVEVGHTGFIDIVLEIDPAEDLALLTVDGVRGEPVAVPKTAYAVNNTRFSLNPGSGAGAVDRVLIEVGGSN